MTATTKLWLLLTAAGLAVALVLSGPQSAPSDILLTSLLTAGAILFEWSASRLPGAGFSSCATAFVLAMALSTGVGVTWATLSAVFSILLRTARRGHPDPRIRGLEGLSDLVPILCSLAAARLIAGVPIWSAGGAVLVYSAAAYELPSAIVVEMPQAMRQRQRTLRARLSAQPLSISLLGVVMSRCVAQTPWFCLVFFPILAQFRKSIEQTLLLEEQSQRRDVVRELQFSRSALDQAAENQNQLRQDLVRKVDEYRTLEMASRVLRQSQSLQQSAEDLVKLCRTFVATPSLVVFFFREGRFVPACYSTNFPDRLLGAELAGWQEPVVERAFRSNSTEAGAEDSKPTRIFPQERFTLAFPLGNMGVLYAGKVDQQFSEAEFRYLSQAASQGALGLQIASQVQTLQEMLLTQQTTNLELKGWSEAVDLLLRYAVGFLDQLDRSVVLERLRQTVQALFPRQSVEVTFSPDPSSQACQAVIASKTPLLIDEIASTHFQPHQPGQHSLLIVPIYHVSLANPGLIILGAERPGAFSRMMRDLLCLLAFLAAIAWKNAELYGETLAAQAQVAQAAKMAAIGQLAAGVAHELNTPLGAISMYVDLARRNVSKDPAKVSERLEKTAEVVAKAKVIVNKLLYYSREATSGRRLSDLNLICRDTLEMVAHSLSVEGVSVDFQAGQVAQIEINQNEIQQVLINLVMNAHDAVSSLTPERKTIVLRTFEGDQKVGFSVADRGEGIAPENQPRIFDPFFTTKPVGHGTGLGLSVTQQIVTAHEGTLSFRTQEGFGSEFQVLLPRSVGA